MQDILSVIIFVFLGVQFQKGKDFVYIIYDFILHNIDIDIILKYIIIKLKII